jgi:hypothetical protein
MDPRQRYRMKRQTIGVSTETHLIVDIPEGAEVVLLEPLDTSETNSQVTVLWEGERVNFFAITLPTNSYSEEPGGGGPQDAPSIRTG